MVVLNFSHSRAEPSQTYHKYFSVWIEITMSFASMQNYYKTQSLRKFCNVSTNFIHNQDFISAFLLLIVWATEIGS